MARKRVRAVESGTESTDVTEKYESKGNCPHIAKGVDIGSLKKAWKKRDEVSCLACKKKTPTNKKTTSGKEQDIWICMKCGHIGCGNSRHDHGLEHFRTPHSDCHAVVALVDTWTVRCIQCHSEINLDVNTKAVAAIEYLKKNLAVAIKEEKADSEEKPVPSQEEKKQLATKSQPPSQKEFKILVTLSPNSTSLPMLGLENIGNTCYANAVLQCLAQTPNLVSELQESISNTGSFILPGGEKLLGKDNERTLKPLECKLGEAGLLTNAVNKILSRVQNGISLRKTGVKNENPCDILRIMKRISNIFYIGEQNDSHELLRVLLEGLRNEEYKRHQHAILRTVGMSIMCQNLQPEELVAYKKQVLQRETLVDRIFNGSLVSILRCTECNLVTTNIEGFLDISLPIKTEKPIRLEHPSLPVDIKLSKHQLKKERKQARRVKKKPRSGKVSTDVPSGVETNKNNSSSGSGSDSGADVEDNIDMENPSTAQEDLCEKKSEKDVGITKKLMDEYDLKSSFEAIESSLCETRKSDNPENHEQLNIYDCAPESGMVSCLTPIPDGPIYGCSPEPANSLTITLGCSPEPSCNEDFGSCEGGRGSPASSIEQADWDDDSNEKPDVTMLGKDVEKVLDLSQDGCPMPEPFEISDDDNLKDAVKEETVVFDAQFPEFLPQICSTTSEGSAKNVDSLNDLNRKKEDLFNNLDDEGSVKNLYDDLSSLKEGRIDEMSNLSMDDKVVEVSSLNKTVLVDTSVETNMETDDDIWGETVAPFQQVTDQGYNLYTCLNNYFSKEILSGANQIGCTHCTRRKEKGDPKPNTKLVQTNALKQLLFLKLPNVLTLHLKRFEVIGTNMSKISRKISFPLVLDVSPYTSVKTKCVTEQVALYELFAVIEHSGHMTSGHYVAYIGVPQNPNIPTNGDKTATPNSREENDICPEVLSDSTNVNQAKTFQNNTNMETKWYFVSDTHVKEVNLKEVFSAEAYILFYKRIQ